MTVVNGAFAKQMFKAAEGKEEQVFDDVGIQTEVVEEKPKVVAAAPVVEVKEEVKYVDRVIVKESPTKSPGRKGKSPKK